MQRIKVGFLVSYDYQMLRISLPLIYKSADQIFLAIDHLRRTWSGNTFEISSDFFSWIKEIDIENKIQIYEDDFYVPSLTVKENDTRERNMLGMFMGAGGWHLQIDSDEYFIDFDEFISKLKVLKFSENTTIYLPWITLFKKVENGFLYIKGKKEFCPIATNYPVYVDYRLNSKNLRKEMDYVIIHESWARNEDALEKKLTNWSHKDDFNVQSYFTFWKAIDSETAKYIRNFHPLTPKIWNSLQFIPCNDVEETFAYFKNELSMGRLFSTFNPLEEKPLLQLIKERIKRKLGRN
jgi:hypothetical protein